MLFVSILIQKQQQQNKQQQQKKHTSFAMDHKAELADFYSYGHPRVEKIHFIK